MMNIAKIILVRHKGTSNIKVLGVDVRDQGTRLLLGCMVQGRTSLGRVWDFVQTWSLYGYPVNFVVVLS